jgi:DNA-binding MarR family transcriptional regulator
MKSNKKIVDFENSIGPWLGRTIKTVDYFLQESFNKNDLDLTKEQMIVLKKLHDQDGLNQNELAFLTLRDKSSLTRLLKKMELKKLIERKSDKDDKRNNIVYITSLGRETFTKTIPVIERVIKTMERNISQEEKKKMIQTLKKIQTNFNSRIEHI